MYNYLVILSEQNSKNATPGIIELQIREDKYEKKAEGKFLKK